MTFGAVKSLIEKNLLESYKNEKEFKKTLREFKHNVLSNKSMSKAYTLYDQLSTPQGLSEQDAKYFIEEADLGRRGVFYRLQIGDFFNQIDAEEFCTRFVSQAQKTRSDCIIVE